MSNMPSIDKTRLTARIQVLTRAKLRTYCRENGLTENDAVAAAVEAFLSGVKPSREDEAWATEERKKNANNRKQ